MDSVSGERTAAISAPTLEGHRVVLGSIHVDLAGSSKLSAEDARSLAAVLMRLADQLDDLNARVVPHLEAALAEAKL